MNKSQFVSHWGWASKEEVVRIPVGMSLEFTYTVLKLRWFVYPWCYGRGVSYMSGMVVSSHLCYSIVQTYHGQPRLFSLWSFASTVCHLPPVVRVLKSLMCSWESIFFCVWRVFSSWDCCWGYGPWWFLVYVMEFIRFTSRMLVLWILPLHSRRPVRRGIAQRALLLAPAYIVRKCSTLVLLCTWYFLDSLALPPIPRATPTLISHDGSLAIRCSSILDCRDFAIAKCCWEHLWWFYWEWESFWWWQGASHGLLYPQYVEGHEPHYACHPPWL